MGISSLLRFVGDSAIDAHISIFENQFVAIDAYCWIHKGIYCCSFDLAMKKPTTKYVTYCMRYIDMLHHFKVKPILVFDGRILSSKKETETKRREDRERKYKKGIELIKAGKINDGRKLLGESVDVTHELVLNLIKCCRKMNIDCIVAPFEADAQLAYFSLRNIVKCIITEDSDLLAYGCETVMFKMDTCGKGKLIEKNKLPASLGLSENDFENKFRHMCILSGCDYLSSLNSIGPANALKFVKVIDDKDIYEALPKLPLYLNKMKLKVSDEYISQFRMADNTFKHQLVYDPFVRKQVPLTPVSNEDDIVGEKLPDDLAFQLAIGNVDPITLKKVDNFDPDKLGTGFNILWKTDLLPNATPKETNINFRPSVCESKKRNLEVFTFNNEIKKQCTRKNIPSVKSASKVPATGFVFEPKLLNSKKKLSLTLDDSKLLKSRYFVSENEKNELHTKIDKRKDETYEEYLQRLCNEVISVENDETAELESTNKVKFCCENSNIDSLNRESCLFCKKCPKCCKCVTSNDTVNGTQQLKVYLKEFEDLKNKKKVPVVEHFLLDEICKNQVQENEQLKEISGESELLQSFNDKKYINGTNLDFQSKKIPEFKTENENKTIHNNQEIFSKQEVEVYGSPRSQCTGTPENVEIEKENRTINSNEKTFCKQEVEVCESPTSQCSGTSESFEIEKENKTIDSNEEIFCKQEVEVYERPPSPVFKIQRKKPLKIIHKPENNFIDGVTSEYFSPSSKSRTFPNFQAAHQTLTSTKNSSTKKLSSTSSKSRKSVPKCSSSKTLFQFGFKKGLKEEIVEKS